MPQGLLIYNPVAGRFPVRPFLWLAVRALTEAGWHIEILPTRSGEHATALACQAAEEGVAAVFACGGDGTIGQVAAGLVGSSTALGILPAGTANVLALEFGLPVFSWTRWWALGRSARLLARAPLRLVDAGLCNDHPFLMWAGMGLDAMAVHAVEPRVRVEKFFSVPHYAMTTIWKASQWNGVHLRLWADGQEIEGHFLLAVANNIRHYMGGLAVLSPHAYLDDGQIDLWLFQGHTLADAFRQAYDLWRGRHIHSTQVRRIPFRSLQVEADSPFLVQTDGEPRPATQWAVLSVRPRALSMLVPPQGMNLFLNTI